jgi:GNAT superfamily N-acetyltransferase
MAAVISTGTPDLRLRFAEPADAPLILELVRELAAYERLAHEVTADIPTLRASLFGDRPAAEVIIAEWRDEAVGFALFFGNFSTFLGKPGIYLEDLFVRPAFRRHGIGRTLLAYLAVLAKERGCGRLEWAVLDWNEAAIGFYRGLGARPMDDWTVFRVTGEALGRLAGEFR